MRALQLLDAGAEATDAGKRCSQQHRQQCNGQIVEELPDLGHRAADIARVVVQLGTEQRARNDPQRQLRHVSRHVAHLALAPDRVDAIRLVDHHGRIGGDAAAVEGRLQHATLAQVEIALAREQAVSQHDAGPFEAGPLLE